MQTSAIILCFCCTRVPLYRKHAPTTSRNHIGAKNVAARHTYSGDPVQVRKISRGLFSCLGINLLLQSIIYSTRLCNSHFLILLGYSRSNDSQIRPRPASPLQPLGPRRRPSLSLGQGPGEEGGLGGGRAGAPQPVPRQRHRHHEEVRRVAACDGHHIAQVGVRTLALNANS